MSQVGANITIDDIKPGESWALIAHTAINHSGDHGAGAAGIMAASSDIEAIILAGGIESLFIFPDVKARPGLYLWHGKIEEDDEFIGRGEQLNPFYMEHWLGLNGTTP
jgi:hypothetical protein